MEFKQLNILITGGFGYLGGRLAQFLESQVDYKIYLSSRKKRVSPEWIKDANIIQISLSSNEELKQVLNGIDVVVHLAGMNAQECVADPIAAIECNAVSTARLINACLKENVKRFVYISSAHVYGNQLTGNINEKTFPSSLHPYATSHRAGEDVVLAANQRGDLEGLVIRLSNAYGPPSRKDANCWMLLVNDLCRQAVVKKKLQLNSSGSQRRDFIPISDFCRVIKHLIELPLSKIDNGLFNVGGNWAPTILEMTSLIAEQFFVETAIKLEISCKPNAIIEESLSLEYDVSKILSTGFELSGRSCVNREINDLIKFCLHSFKK